MIARLTEMATRLAKPIRRLLVRPAVGRLAVAALVLLVAAEAWARMGGGDSFSGGSSGGGGGGGGGGGDAELIFWLVWLCIEHPVIGIPLTVVVGLVWLAKRKQDKNEEEWETSAPNDWPPVQALPHGRKQLETLRTVDPEFSVAVFEDFLYALYSKAHEARGAGTLDMLSPYLSGPARARFYGAVPGLAQVKGVIVAGMQIQAVRGVAPDSLGVGVSVVFESNFTEVVRQGGEEREQTYWALERWDLTRRRGARSRAPQKASVIGCPNCGAALTEVRGSTCSYCGKVVDSGEFDWRVDAIQVLRLEERKALFTSHVQERGTNLPTVVDLEAHARLEQLGRKDPQFDWGAFSDRVKLVFVETQSAWSERDWTRARPFVSDHLFQSQLYWIETFLQNGLRNVVERPNVEGVQLACVTSDVHFDSITVRVVASCIDYVYSEAQQKVLTGSRSQPRRFTEYWTFIRAAGRSGRPGTEPKCPNCGAPLQINQAGTCEYCQAKVTTGQYDWVLSRIEQDEAYGG